MWQSVIQAFPGVTARFEGYIEWMYLDIKGLLSTGVGNLIDTVNDALQLPWLRPDGSRASSSEITSVWHIVKAAPPAMNASFYAKLSDLRLADTDIDILVAEKLASNEYKIRQQFVNYDKWPSDAQMAINLIAWARGPSGFHNAFPRFSQAMDEDRFAAAAPESQMDATGNAGLVPRNDLIYALLMNAQRVVDERHPYDQFLDKSIVQGSTVPHHTLALHPQSKSQLLTVIGILSVGVGMYYILNNLKRIKRFI